MTPHPPGPPGSDPWVGHNLPMGIHQKMLGYILGRSWENNNGMYLGKL
jgi:hypothetical protein